MMTKTTLRLQHMAVVLLPQHQLIGAQAQHEVLCKAKRCAECEGVMRSTTAQRLVGGATWSHSAGTPF